MFFIVFLRFLGYVKKLNEEQENINKYLETKLHEEAEQKYKKKMKQAKQTIYRNELAKKIFDGLPDIESLENKCYQKAVEEFAEKWDEQEQKKFNHYNVLREDRIEHHKREKETLQKLQQQQKQAYELDKLNRKNNEIIDFVFDRQQHSDKVNRIKNLRKFISAQIELDKKNRRDELAQNRLDTNRIIENSNKKDDQTFFSYAAQLMNNARENGHPLTPLKRTIDEYKIQNCLLPPKDDMPHLKSNIDIGISLERKFLKKTPHNQFNGNDIAMQ